MKVNKKILLLLPLLVVVFLLLWFAFQPAASTAEFLHNSVEYSKTSLYEVESIMLEEGKPSRNTVTEPRLIDTNLKYTFEKDGRKEIYYGEQVLPIHKEFGIDYHVIID